MRVVDVLVVPASESEPMRMVAVADGDTAVLRALVDDVSTDTVFFSPRPVYMVVSAHAKAMAASVANPRATNLAEWLLPSFAKYDRVEGAAVFIGLDGEGDAAGLPEDFRQMVAARFGEPVAS